MLWLCIIFMLLIKIHLLQKSAREIERAFSEKLITHSNTLIDISSNDKYMRRLANTINNQLRILRRERQKFQQGDLELKNAVTNISHDLRTPLTAICGYLDLLEKEEKTEAANRYVHIIRNRTELLSQLTGELFRYSVILTSEEPLKTEPVVLNHLLEESISSFYTVLKESNITPYITMPDEKIIRCLDSAALARVFSNLLNNAVKYSEGNLYITLTKAGEVYFKNPTTKLTETQVGKLFDRFYTVSDARNSTGLGLSIAKNLVEKMGGKISASYKQNVLSICISFGE
ncbi:MAG: HAMP domain-containing sensor histidine kinase [Blautia sp.]|uniref:sensor histidine kinase n=1 Tax=Blautia sp. TaxID=1955243 RepID=UPI002E771AA5|nr:HAMP domain-containing sensor histidine kinase [Blautia sp.]MEE1443388.1 HAMP domain-containing sensor histidine kinase [Blautia sp.]